VNRSWRSWLFISRYRFSDRSENGPLRRPKPPRGRNPLHKRRRQANLHPKNPRIFHFAWTSARTHVITKTYDAHVLPCLLYYPGDDAPVQFLPGIRGCLSGYGYCGHPAVAIGVCLPTGYVVLAQSPTARHGKRERWSDRPGHEGRSPRHRCSGHFLPPPPGVTSAKPSLLRTPEDVSPGPIHYPVTMTHDDRL
jgi:hypothetical protein